MSDAQTIKPGDATHAAAHGNDHGHDPHVAHHFDSMGQQFDAGKLGMWVFLATELLMFGGLFCAYAVYRANHPEVFAYAHHSLNTTLGGINTVVLIASSLTMAWAVRCAQLGKNRALIICLALSLLGGLGFLCIKTIEYHHKYELGLWIGISNKYHPKYTGPHSRGADHHAETNGTQPDKAAASVVAPQVGERSDKQEVAGKSTDSPDIDRSKLSAPAAGPTGTSAAALEMNPAKSANAAAHTIGYEDLAPSDQVNVYTFFHIYYLMTGLHGLHVLIGMGLIFWVLVRASRPGDRKWVVLLAPMGLGLFGVYVGLVIHVTWVLIAGVAIAGASALAAILAARSAAVEGDKEGDFSPKYFNPVDLVGLYWHLVDLIWIFLFPLLYLIH